MIERRFERRPARRLGVRVHDHNGHLLRSSTRNITANGAFIEIGPADFPTAKVLWVDLPDPLAESGWTNVAALEQWRQLYNTHWLIERHGHRSPAQVRQEWLIATGREAA